MKTSFINNLVIIQNAINIKQRYVKVLRTKLIINFLKILYRNGFINGFFAIDEKYLFIMLKYINNKPVFKKFNFISKPSRYVFVTNRILKRKFFNKGFFLISSSSYGLLLLNTNDFFEIEKLTTLQNGGILVLQIII